MVEHWIIRSDLHKIVYKKDSSALKRREENKHKQKTSQVLSADTQASSGLESPNRNLDWRPASGKNNFWVDLCSGITFLYSSISMQHV